MNHELENRVQEVLACERAWVEAHRTLDMAALDRLMGADYAIIRPDGSVDGKAAALASYRDHARAWDEADSDEYDVRVYGDVAVLIGRWQARGVNTGERFDYRARFLAVYVKRDGRWQLVADSSTEIT